MNNSFVILQTFLPDLLLVEIKKKNVCNSELYE